MPKKRKQSRAARPEPGSSPKPKRREPVFRAEDTSPTPTPNPVTPGLVVKRRKKKGKHRS